MRPLVFVLVLAALLVTPACGGKDDDPKTPAAGGTDPVTPATQGSQLTETTAGRVATSLAKGRAFLVGQQDEGGGWGDPGIKIPPNVGYTAMAAGGLLAATPKTSVEKDDAILKALRFIAAAQKESGAIFSNPQYTNYETSSAAGVFALARVGAFAKAQSRARAYLASSQIAGDEADPSHGGFPYKQDQGYPSDLSNAQFAATTLHDLGLEKDHVVWKRLVAYLGRVQNYGEVNKGTVEREVEGERRVYVSGEDGGAVYGPGMGKAPDVKRADGTWEIKSYGSMTYALLKCLLFAGVDATDPRVVLAVKWISDHWTVDRNPGFEGAEDPEKASQQGYYYFLYTASRALAAFEAHTKKPLTITDAQGRAHNWREEMARALLARQADDGSWVNAVAERWDEGSKVLASGYAMQTLAFLTGRLP